MDDSDLVSKFRKSLESTNDDNSASFSLAKFVLEMLETMEALTQDAQETDELYKVTSLEFAARTCIKVFFSEIEARVYLLQQLILHTNSIQESKLTNAEILLLEGESYYVKDNGDIRSSKSFLPFKSSLLFTLKISSRFFNPDVFRDTSDPNWQHVLELIKVRNRITHPKCVSDLIITEKEISSFHKAQEWVRKAFSTVFSDEEYFKKLKKKAEQEG